MALSLFSATLSLTTWWLMSSKQYKWGFIVSLFTQVPWAYLGISSGLYGMTILSGFLFIINVRGLINLRKSE